MTQENKEHQEWRFYGRRVGKKLNTTRRAVLDTLYPKLAVPEDKITKEEDLDPTALFSFKPEKIIFEIGFGNGERLAQHIQKEPKTGFIGAEPFSNGMSTFLKDIESEGSTKNIRVHMDDAISLAKSFKSHSIDQIMVLNPDPWHKKRHHKRRIIQQENLDIFARILKTGGKLVMTTDVRDLIEWMVTESSNHPAFTWDAEKAADWKNTPENWISTRYETKGAKGADRMHYLFFTRI
ncbi:MAG: tRNA (guanosine(46)-N7)-methyltransferase TrmB [Pseudomonadota bacterium]